MQSRSEDQSDWLPGLDGLRAIAVLLVMAFHLDTRQWVPGGFLGVDLFFVLSGFLITRLLLAERDRSGRVALPSFYVRRIRRLLPALVCVIVLVGTVSFGVYDEDSRHHPSPDVWARSVLWSLGYGYNWLVALEVPYLYSLKHVWSLSVEEQFYVVWPAVLIGALHFGVDGKRIRMGLMVAIAASLALPLVYYEWIPFWHWGGDWSRLYHGSDYRAHALLAGCLLALFWSDPDWRRRLRRRTLDRSAFAAALVIAGVALTLPIEATSLYLGGLATVVLACAVIVLWTVESTRESAVHRFLESRAMVWIGQRSYGLYLYHFPFVVWTRSLDLPVFDQAALVVLTTFLLAEASYRWVERPIVESGRRRAVARPGPAAESAA